jgi:hypothetical protein
VAEAQEIRANQGTPDALPHGEAAALNEAMPAELAPAELLEEAPVEEVPDLEPATAADFDPPYVPETEEDEFLTGPTNKPAESQTAGAQYPTPLSVRTRAALPVLQAAASDPSATPELIALTRLLVREASR